MKLRIATCLSIPEPDVDEAPLLAALHQRGIDAQMVAWDDPGADWAEPVPTIIRSTWNYIHDLPGFLAWSRRAAAAAPLWNPPAIIAGNAHKSYLAALAAAGHAVVPTLFVARGETVPLATLCAERGFPLIVIKPTVSAGSFGTRRFEPSDPEAQAFLDELVAERDAMVQAYVPSVESHGERSLVFIDGELTHAMRKSPRFAGEDESVSGPHAIGDDERALAEAVLAPLAADLLYARVDLARGPDGGPMVMELELIEPSLFLLQHPPALERLCAALARRLSPKPR